MATEGNEEQRVAQHKGYKWIQNEHRRWDTCFAVEAALENCLLDITSDKHWLSITVDIEGERWTM